MAIRRPLDGMLVLDLGQIYNGPYCGLTLGFMGARVLKIEPPEGDVVRRRKREVEPWPLVMLNSNKEFGGARSQAAARQGALPRAWSAKADVADRELRRRRHGSPRASAGTCCTSSTRAWSMAAAPVSGSTAPIAISPPWTSPSRP